MSYSHKIPALLVKKKVEAAEAMNGCPPIRNENLAMRGFDSPRMPLILQIFTDLF